MYHPRWREGNLSTGFIAEEYSKGFAPRERDGEIARRRGAVAAAIDHVLGERKRQISGQMIGRPVKRERRRAVWLDREEIPLEIVREADALEVRFVNGATGHRHRVASSWKPGERVWHGQI